MDDPDCDLDQLHRTYQHFALLNRVISGWDKIYTQCVRPRLVDSSKIYRLLDIGFGGGDVPLRLIQLAQHDGYKLEGLAIDTDSRALDYVRQREWPATLSFSSDSLSLLKERKERFDFVISNHLVHHLEGDELLALLDDALTLSKGLVLFGDIRRSAAAYGSYSVFSSVLRNSFARKDGLLSIRRSYTASELRDLVPAPWQVSKMFPYRLLLTHSVGCGEIASP